MKYLTICFFALASVSLSASATPMPMHHDAQPKSMHHTMKPMNGPHETGHPTLMSESQTPPSREPLFPLALHEKADSAAKPVDHIPVAQKLIPIYRQKDWIKLGNPQNGKVGWAKYDRYQQWLHWGKAKTKPIIKPFIQSVVITVTEKTDEKGDAQIIAYKNGKRLSDQEAKKLLKQVHQQQHNLQKRFDRLQKNMRHFFKTFWDDDVF
jgi:hypothetical protein